MLALLQRIKLIQSFWYHNCSHNKQIKLMFLSYHDLFLQQKKFNHEANGVSESEHSSVLYVFILCSTVTLALGVLTGWHCHLIGRGETSIEWHSNIEEARTFRKQGLVRVPTTITTNTEFQFTLIYLFLHYFQSHTLYLRGKKEEKNEINVTQKMFHISLKRIQKNCTIVQRYRHEVYLGLVSSSLKIFLIPQ